jgi:hypothetical protein
LREQITVDDFELHQKVTLGNAAGWAFIWVGDPAPATRRRVRR